MKLELVLASANPDKVAEIAAILGPAVHLLPRPAELGDVVEDADTLEGNARLKAIAVMEATGRPAVADDTGLEVDALGGAPGVRTARFAGEAASYADNVAKMIESLLHVAPPHRRARFRTVALVAWPSGAETLAEGTVDGSIANAESGHGGFGYDPIFVPDDGDGRTFADMSPDEKHAISHRGRAFRALAGMLSDLPAR